MKDITTTSVLSEKESRTYRTKKARNIAGEIFALYNQGDKIGRWELDRATDAIYAYIKELDDSE